MKNYFLQLFTWTLIVSISFIFGCKKENDDNPPGPTPQEIIGWAIGGPVDGYGSIIYTADGENWVRQGDSTMIPNVEISDIYAIDKNNAWAVGARDNGYGTILRTSNGGLTWERQGNKGSIPDTDLGGVRAVSNNIAWAAGTSEVILKTTDGGATWVKQAEGLFPGANYYRLFAYDKDHVWAVGAHHNDSIALIVYTGDGGATWEIQGADVVQPTDLYILDIHAFDANNVWTAGRSAIYITTDQGTTWMRKDGPNAYDNNGICVVGTSKAFVVSDYCNIDITGDQGDTWDKQIVSCTTQVASYIMGITALDENNLWAVNSNFDPNQLGSIFRTTDGGNTWVELVCPVNAQLRRISFVGDLR
ncbi:MAG: hypothetical protein IMY74_02355 [Bacteroidetes bacterium]|nr:hypothetical protein [Bacteroidota bacterium]MCK5765051.1 hypothetical protein [Bacteroidales bacterium]